ncbi:AMP-dependent synthetase/ligase [[Mycobacterium] nativiensis]|uniref:Acyl-CoA synthetase n=1 Tax=[Mycobacterium] nativiensis TaxID=2855503 RepID=A0ABU5XPU4_9MYCO|nr:long-chain fatty acid--CoA ligase [Mycolicibacter sp. MYC340]MEB3029999.1 long-chain fatty acid--CoA ligase [Mycolicibacter sp. MYC340]
MTTTDPVSRLTQARSLCELFQRTCATRAGDLALRTPDGGTALTWGEYGARVQRLAAGLSALGVCRGDTVAIMLTNRPEFHLIDAAAYHLGAIPFSVYNTSAPAQIAYLFDNAANRVVVCEEQFLEHVLEAKAGSRVEHVICLGDAPAGTMTLAEVEDLGDPEFDFESCWRAVQADDTITIIYTSGTTGTPKGVEMSHRNAIFGTEAMLGIPEFAAGCGGRVASYLPDAHALNRWLAHYLPAVTGAAVYTVADSKDLAAALPTIRPTVFVGVPMLWYKLEATVRAALSAEPGLRGTLAAWALQVGRRKVAADLAGKPISPLLRLKYLPAERLILARLRQQVGLDQTAIAYSGAAPITPETLEFLLALGIPVAEAWGMSEIGLATSNRPGAQRVGTVGTVLRRVEIRCLNDGELLVRTPGLMKGYRNDPARTAEVVDDDGWVHTGDIGVIDTGGYVTIVDRKKELIINSAGKNMSPANIENAVRAASPLVGSVVAIGDRRKYVTALITLEPEAAAAFASAHSVEASPRALAADPAVRRRLDAAIAAANARLSRVEQVKAYTVLPVFWEPGSDEITPTMKLRRGVITEKYAREIDALYEFART